MLGNLQALRFFAASGVLLLHSNFAVHGLHTDFYGVAIFFALSGYVMCLVRDRPAATFFVDRVWRIVPPYWVATLLFVFALSAWREVSTLDIVRSLLFIPYHDPRGVYFPVLAVGWTLNMEMYFYVLFTASIAISRRFAPIIAGVLVLSISWALPHVISDGALLFYYANPYLAFFVMGIAIWYGTEWLLRRLPNGFRSPTWVFPLVLLVYVALVLAGVSEFVLVPVLFALTVVLAKTGGDHRGREIMLLGAASYACYLLHTILIAGLRALGIPVEGSTLSVIAIFIGSWVVSVVWYETVERFFARMKVRATSWRARSRESSRAATSET